MKKKELKAQKMYLNKAISVAHDLELYISNQVGKSKLHQLIGYLQGGREALEFYEKKED